MRRADTDSPPPRNFAGTGREPAVLWKERSDMKDFSVKYPVVFGILMILVSFIAAGILTALLSGTGMSSDTAAAVGRILIGVLLLFLFRGLFPRGTAGKGLRWGLVALVFVLWNILYHLMSGYGFAGGGVWGTAFVIALAPAIFEEVLFRGILLGKLRENGQPPMTALLVSAGLFALMHLTNAVSGQFATVLVQVCYAFVVGLLFGAVYLKSGDLVSAMLFHGLVDFSSHLFTGDPEQSAWWVLALFGVMLLLAAVYAIRITPKEDAALPVSTEPIE